MSAAEPVRLTATRSKMPSAPGHLSAEMRKWWHETVGAFALEPHHLRLLEGAATAWDRAADARRDLETNGGATFLDRFGQPKEHPSAGIERQSMIVFARLTRELGLDLTTEAPRPPTRWR